MTADDIHIPHATENLKKYLKSASSISDPILQTGTTIMIGLSSDHGLHWETLHDPEQELSYLSSRLVSNLSKNLFHSVSITIINELYYSYLHYHIACYGYISTKDSKGLSGYVT